MPKTEIDFTKIDSFELNDHLILLKQNASRVQVLNPLASIIWQFKKSGLSNLKIADEISEAFNIPVELALQDIQSINAQWMLDLAISVDEEVPKKMTIPLAKKLSDWHATIRIFFRFPGLTVKVNFDSDIVAEKLRRLSGQSHLNNSKDCE